METISSKDAAVRVMYYRMKSGSNEDSSSSDSSIGTSGGRVMAVGLSTLSEDDPGSVIFGDVTQYVLCKAADDVLLF